MVKSYIKVGNLQIFAVSNDGGCLKSAITVLVKTYGLFKNGELFKTLYLQTTIGTRSAAEIVGN